MKLTKSTWTTDKFIKMSQALGNYYDRSSIATKPDRQRDSWTTDKFIEMSRSLSSAYGVDF